MPVVSGHPEELRPRGAAADRAPDRPHGWLHRMEGLCGCPYTKSPTKSLLVGVDIGPLTFGNSHIIIRILSFGSKAQDKEDSRNNGLQDPRIHHTYHNRFLIIL